MKTVGMSPDRTVSVVIPVFNRAAVVVAAVESVLMQELPDGNWALDLVIVDDASEDDLGASLAEFENRARVVRHSINAGAAAARNTGIAAARGTYVAFLDSDDVWLPGKLRVQLRHMLTRNWPACCTAFQMTRPGRSNVICPTYRKSELELGDMVWGCYFVPGSTMIARRAVLDEIGPADPAFRRLEDWDWSIRYAMRFRLGFIPEALTRHNPSGYSNSEVYLAAIELMRSKHLSEMPPELRRQFAAAIDIHQASASFRGGKWVAAVRPVLQSLMKVPFGNVALTTVLHNRLGTN
jgi:glycosyltransferase involved in cell wall biosynthesis